MYFVPTKLYFKLLSAFLLTFVLFSANQTAYSQQKKKPVPKKTTTKKTVDKPANKNTAKKTVDKPASKTATKTTAKNKKPTPAELKKQAELKKKADADAVKKRAAQQAALEAKRRRDQAIRAAQAKKRALENSFRLETMANIAKDDVSNEDLEIRRTAVNALGSRAGTIVVMEAQTGKVLTMVNQDWAIRKSFKPCSTIKLVTGVAGLDKSLIDSDGNIRDKKFRLNLNDALAYSNNSYFQVVGSNLGSETMISYAQRLGLGQPTGINADGETSGRLPHGNNNARIYSHGDDYEVSPLQLGVMVSAISNGGNVIIPQVPKSKVQKTAFRGSMRRTVNLPKNNLQGVIPGMIGAAEYGTARRGVDATLGVAGKTGSCIEKGSWVGLFASVAPVANPQYAVVVITRGQNERGKYAAAIAGQIYQVLGKRINGGNKNIAKVPLVLKPQPKVNATTSVRIDTEEGEDSEDADPVVSQKVITETKNAATSNKKTVPKPSELFPPVVIEPKDANSRPRVVKKN